MADYGKLSDHELTALMKQDDQVAFTEIYNRYWNKLFTAAANKIEDFQEAEDVVQQLFITIWNRREVLEITSSLQSYLSVAVKYRVLKALAKQYRQKNFGDESAEKTLAELEDNSTQEWLEFQEIKERLNVLIDQLPEKTRTVYRMTREQGMTQKQVAEELDISEKTVEFHMSKALKNLKTGLKSFFITL
ncbi:RNA polymerase sigma-70 factor [Pedobacter sp. PWIIR3]